ncbi:hypothetical protein EGW08_019864 [Elysia chlorotica]|uniref:RNA exonuclease 4 n=1 Tax=Elysia chlorotica TaxID=188477 RepID=A0A433SSX7_ELYCH|nr:hypothetical protein EGW08_019864 [Elysia chlorotica]
MSSFSSVESVALELKNKTLRSRRQKRWLSSLSDMSDSPEGMLEPKIAKTEGSDEPSIARTIVLTASKDKDDEIDGKSQHDSKTDDICDLEKESDGSTSGFCDDSVENSVHVEDTTELNNNEVQSVQSSWSVSRGNIPNWMYVALDCEMVGTGPKGKKSVLGRCSIVDYRGNVIFDKFARPDEPVTDYRTRWSGIRPCHLAGAQPVQEVLEEVYEILANKIIVGHSVYNDFRALKMNPPFYSVRDTAQCKALTRRAGLQGQGNGLKRLTSALLGRNIQTGSTGHCSVEDALATLDLFKLVRQEFEADLYTKWAKKSSKQIMGALAAFVQKAHASRGLRVRVDSGGDRQFLGDEYWPSDVTEDSALDTV